MQGVSTFKLWGLKRAAASRATIFRLKREQFGNVVLPRADIPEKKSKIFPTLIFGFDKLDLAIASLAFLLLLCVQSNSLAHAKKLNSHPISKIGSFRRAIEFPNLAPLRQRGNSLACNIFCFAATKCCQTSYYHKIFGYP
jgi:hypothetical protein